MKQLQILIFLCTTLFSCSSVIYSVDYNYPSEDHSHGFIVNGEEHVGIADYYGSNRLKINYVVHGFEIHFQANDTIAILSDFNPRQVTIKECEINFKLSYVGLQSGFEVYRILEKNESFLYLKRKRKFAVAHSDESGNGKHGIACGNFSNREIKLIFNK